MGEGTDCRGLNPVMDAPRKVALNEVQNATPINGKDSERAAHTLIRMRMKRLHGREGSRITHLGPEILKYTAVGEECSPHPRAATMVGGVSGGTVFAGRVDELR